MEKLEKFRKLCKNIQLYGMIIIIAAGMGFIFLMNRTQEANSTNQTTFLLYSMIVVLVLLIFMVFITAPMQASLLKKVILFSLDGLVDKVTFNRKKGYTKEAFAKLRLVPDEANQYANSDYYSFYYKDMFIESTTVRVYDEMKVEVPRKQGSTKMKIVKRAFNHFFGRVYIIPLGLGCAFNVYGKKSPDQSKKKQMENEEYCHDYPIKIKKYYENFEVFYKTEKPEIDMQTFLEKLFNLKLAAKGPVSAFVRKKNLVICIDNSHHYEEIETKNPIDENIVRGYRKDVSMVLTFINSIKPLQVEEKE